jgi:hypothetical protein
MERNMGQIDRLVRSFAAVNIFSFYYIGVLQGTPGKILLIIAGAFVVSAIFAVCPLYQIFGISTCSKKHGSKIPSVNNSNPNYGKTKNSRIAAGNSKAAPASRVRFR